MKRSLLFLSLIGSSMALHAQLLTAVTGLTLFEHHSSSINNNSPFGSDANPSQSGYDFVTRSYYNSFNPTTFGAYTAGEEANIDMVEHNGTYGNQGNFGFTSAVSTIWNGDIKGNNTTLWIEAPASFNYQTVTAVSDIVGAFNTTTATKSIGEAKEGKVYLAKIRNTNLYVAMRCYNVKNAASPGGIKDVSFDFDYKYGTLIPTTTEDIHLEAKLSVYPNPVSGSLNLKNNSNLDVNITVFTPLGQTMGTFALAKNALQTMDMSTMAAGVYYLNCTTADGKIYKHKFVKY